MPQIKSIKNSPTFSIRHFLSVVIVCSALCGCSLTPTPRTVIYLNHDTAFSLTSFHLPELSQQFFLKVADSERTQLFQGIIESKDSFKTMALLDQVGSRIAILQQTNDGISLQQRPMSNMLVPADEILMAVLFLCSDTPTIEASVPNSKVVVIDPQQMQLISSSGIELLRAQGKTTPCPQGIVLRKNYSLTFTFVGNAFGAP